MHKYILPLILFLSLLAYSNDLDDALIEAAKNGNLREVKTLIKDNANVNAQDNDGVTALMLASDEGHTEIAKYLVENGANINQQSIYGLTALDYALHAGNTEIIKYLKKIDIAINGNPEINRLLIEFAGKGNIDKVKWSIQNGANVNPKNGYSSALAVASAYGHLEVVKLLVEEYDADIDIQFYYAESDSSTETALMIASDNSNFELVKYLVDNGADVNIGAGFDYHYETPLMIASRNGNFELVKYLVKNGADVNSGNGFDNTVLTAAIWVNELEIARYLSKKGAKGIYLNEIFIDKAGQGDLNTVKYLVELGVDINDYGRYHDMRTALIRASNNEQLEVVKYLVDIGADIHMKDREGSTALDLASESGHTKVVKLLKKAGAK